MNDLGRPAQWFLTAQAWKVSDERKHWLEKAQELLTHSGTVTKLACQTSTPVRHTAYDAAHSPVPMRRSGAMEPVVHDDLCRKNAARPSHGMATTAG